MPPQGVVYSEKKTSLKLSSIVGDDSEMVYDGLLNGTKVKVIVDNGASHMFVSRNTMEKCGLSLVKATADCELADGSSISVDGHCRGNLEIEKLSFEEDIYVLPSVSNDQEELSITVGRTWLKYFNPDIDWRTNYVKIRRPDGSDICIYPRGTKPKKKVRFKLISIKQLKKIVRKKAGELFAVRVKPKPKPSTMKVHRKFVDIVEEFEDVLIDEIPDELPPFRDVNFEINLKTDEPPPVRPVIRLSTSELQELKRQLQLLLEKGLIRPSSSPYGAPVFFVKKKSGELRMVCDYRALNKITIKDSNPLPLINEALDQVSGATIFSQIDLIGAYHQIRVREMDIPKTAIRTRYGSFEWTVLCFGLTNAPATFTRLLTSLLHELNGECLVLFLDDVLIYSRSIEEHRLHLRKLFMILRKNKLYAKRTKCCIGVPEVDFLGFTVNQKGVGTQRRLISAIEEWPVPSSVKEVQSFLGLANFYRRFVKNYAKIARPLSDVTRQDNYKWESEQAESFEALKQAMTTAPVLAHPKSSEKFVLSTDASKYAVGASLVQNGHPVAFLSHRLTDVETRWTTGDQELLAFIIALKEWSVYLRGRNFVFYTDHEPIRYLQTKPKLNGRQARWLDLLQEYDFDVKHIPGVKNIVPDSLSRRADHVLQFKFMKLQDPQFRNRIIEGYTKDEWSQKMIEMWSNNFSDYKSEDYEKVKSQEDYNKVKSQNMNYKYSDKLLYWIAYGKARVYVPDVDQLRKEIIEGFHCSSHLGKDKIYNSVSLYTYWKNQYRDVEKFVSSCHECQKNKTKSVRPSGELQPLGIPSECWSEITCDFVSSFPKSNRGKDTVLVIVDRLSKQAIFVPTTENVDAQAVRLLFEDALFSKHGVPSVIVSDRDPKFTSNYWKCLAELNLIELNMSTSSHPQTDGQSENLIRTLSNMIRSYIQQCPEDWDLSLSQLEFEYNCSKHKTTGLAPFEIELGRIPTNPFTKSLSDCNIKNQKAADYVERIAAYKRIARDKIAEARSSQKYYADKKRRPVAFKEGDLVMLRSETLDTFNRSTLPKKWRPKYLGPLKVIKVMGPVTYKIELPPSMKKAHNVFHVSKLKKFIGKEIQGTIDIVIDADGTSEQEVAEILDKKRIGRKLHYLVRFEGDPESEALWLQKSDLKNCMDLVNEFERSLKKKNVAAVSEF